MLGRNSGRILECSPWIWPTDWYRIVDTKQFPKGQHQIFEYLIFRAPLSYQFSNKEKKSKLKHSANHPRFSTMLEQNPI